MIKKNDELIVDIIDNGFQGEGIAKADGMTIFIPETLKGEKAKIKVLKVASNIAYGKALEIIEKNEHRVDSDCETYSRCGGCNMRHIDYARTLEIKKEAVQTTLRKALGREEEIVEVIGMDKPYYYRNKLQYPVGKDDNGNAVMGVFAERSHRIIPTEHCMIQDKLSQRIANDLFEYIRKKDISVYDEEARTGAIRHIIIRIGKKTNEVMITIVTNTENIDSNSVNKKDKQAQEKIAGRIGNADRINDADRISNAENNTINDTETKLVSYIVAKYPEIKTIVKNINNKNTNVILGYDKANVVLYGEGYIEDYLGDFKFKISPMSFYQVNPVQTEKLYSKAVEYAELKGKETIFDLYCGIGTIGIFASPKAKKIYGIETVKDAIEDAKINAELNGIKNAEYYVGDVEKFLPEFIEKNQVKADVVFLDPPRKGCDKAAIETLLEIQPEKIVYVSCNPATLARDIGLLEEKYELKKLALVDMFPYTSHIESVALLYLK